MIPTIAILFLLAGMAIGCIIFVFGYMLGHDDTKEVIIQNKPGEVIKYEQTKPVPVKQTEPKPGGLFRDTNESRIIERPTPQQLKKWNEDETTRQSKEAMKETLDKDPNMQKIKELKQQYGQSNTNSH